MFIVLAIIAYVFIGIITGIVCNKVWLFASNIPRLDADMLSITAGIFWPAAYIVYGAVVVANKIVSHYVRD